MAGCAWMSTGKEAEAFGVSFFVVRPAVNCCSIWSSSPDYFCLLEDTPLNVSHPSTIYKAAPLLRRSIDQ